MLSGDSDPATQTMPRYRARISRESQDIQAAQTLRSLAFTTQGADGDRFDKLCDHLLVEECHNNTLVCCARLLRLTNGRDINSSYSAQFYDLSGLVDFPGAMAEVGRFCIHPNWDQADILRAAWGEMTAYVDENGIEMMFGCSSFAGIDPETYLDTFAMLKDRHMAPPAWMPRIKSREIIQYVRGASRILDLKRAMTMMPPLLRTYLLMGGWVSDHAVVDHQMNTLHVFTGLEIGAIPASRKRILRSLAARNTID